MTLWTTIWFFLFLIVVGNAAYFIFSIFGPMLMDLEERRLHRKKKKNELKREYGKEICDDSNTETMDD